MQPSDETGRDTPRARIPPKAIACRALGVPLVLLGLLMLTQGVETGCTLGGGAPDSTVRGVLRAPNCWTGPFDLNPDYFAAVPFDGDDSLQIRIQNGGDFQTFSDGLLLRIEHLQTLRQRLKASTESPPRLQLPVSLPPDVVPPGSVLVPTATPPWVHMNLYLQRSCRTQNVALYAVEEVALSPSGECVGPDAPPLVCPNLTGTSGSPPSLDGGAEAIGTDSGAGTPPKVGRSTIEFTSLFSGNPDERLAEERLTRASFSVYLADPRDTCPGPRKTPPPCRGWLKGSFAFYFQRGRPSQPFP